jgi:hypothetical protein
MKPPWRPAANYAAQSRRTDVDFHPDANPVRQRDLDLSGKVAEQLPRGRSASVAADASCF